jgi:hypothetical protein
MSHDQRTTVVDAGDLAAESRRLLERLEQARGVSRAAAEALEAALTPEQRELSYRASDAENDRTMAYYELLSAEMARHAPGLAPMIRLLWEHAVQTSTDELGTCCTPETGYSL